MGLMVVVGVTVSLSAAGLLVHARIRGNANRTAKKEIQFIWASGV